MLRVSQFKRMRDDAEPSLAMDRLQRLLQRPQARHRLLEEEGDEMALQRRHLFAGNDLDAILAPRPGLARLEASLEVIVVGDRR